MFGIYYITLYLNIANRQKIFSDHYWLDTVLCPPYNFFHWYNIHTQIFHWITIIRAASFYDLWWYAHHDDDMLMIAICIHTLNILINDYLIDYNDFITPVFPSESILLLFFILFWSSASNAHHLLDIFVPFLIFYYKFILIQLFLCFIKYFIIVTHDDDDVNDMVDDVDEHNTTQNNT